MMRVLVLCLATAAGARAETAVPSFDASVASVVRTVKEARAEAEESLLSRLIDSWRALLAGYPFTSREWDGGVDTLRHRVVRTDRCRFEVTTTVETRSDGYLVAKRDARIDFRSARSAELILRQDADPRDAQGVVGVALKLERKAPVRKENGEGDSVTVYREELEWTGGLRGRPAPEKMQELVFVLNGIKRACARTPVPGPT